jgi:hypothetical protein
MRAWRPILDRLCKAAIENEKKRPVDSIWKQLNRRNPVIARPQLIEQLPKWCMGGMPDEKWSDRDIALQVVFLNSFSLAIAGTQTVTAAEKKRLIDSYREQAKRLRNEARGLRNAAAFFRGMGMLSEAEEHCRAVERAAAWCDAEAREIFGEETLVVGRHQAPPHVPAYCMRLAEHNPRFRGGSWPARRIHSNRWLCPRRAQKDRLRRFGASGGRSSSKPRQRFPARKNGARSAAAGISKASGDCMAHKVAPLIAHQSSGTMRSSQCVRSSAIRTPSVATTVGSGAMPKISACSHGRPSSWPTSGQATVQRQRCRARPRRPRSGRSDSQLRIRPVQTSSSHNLSTRPRQGTERTMQRMRAPPTLLTHSSHRPDGNSAVQRKGSPLVVGLPSYFAASCVLRCRQQRLL